MRHKILAGIVVSTMLFGLSGCSTESEKVNYNLRKEADNFNIRRKLTVFNLRTDTVLFQMEGLCSIDTDSDGDLIVTVQTGASEFRQHYIRMAPENCYVVKDITSGTLPEWGFKVTHTD